MTQLVARTGEGYGHEVLRSLGLGAPADWWLGCKGIQGSGGLVPERLLRSKSWRLSAWWIEGAGWMAGLRRSGGSCDLVGWRRIGRDPDVEEDWRRRLGGCDRASKF